MKKVDCFWEKRNLGEKVIYHNYQNMGLGILTPCTLPLFVKNKQLPVNKIVGNISSNNRPVWELYEALGYKVTNPHYVFIRHQ